MNKKGIFKVFACFFILSALLSSCNAAENSVELSSAVDSSAESISNSAGAKSEEATDGSESEEITEESEISEISEESAQSEESKEKFENISKDSFEVESSLMPPEGKTVLYGKYVIAHEIPAYEVEEGYFNTKVITQSMKEAFDSPQNDGACYYVCFDTRNDTSTSPEEERTYFESFGIDVEYYKEGDVFFAYVTEEQINAMISENDNKERKVPYTKMYWIPKDGKEVYVDAVNEDLSAGKKSIEHLKQKNL